MTPKHSPLQTAIVVAMERNGWTQAELGRRAGMPQQMVGRALMPGGGARMATIERLLAALGLEVKLDLGRRALLVRDRAPKPPPA